MFKTINLKMGLAALAVGVVMPVFAEKAPATSSASGSSAVSAEHATKNAVAVRLTQMKVVKNEAGVEKLVDAATVKPNDVIEYRATYTNTSSQTVKGLVANLPIPEGLEYIPKSVKPGTSAQAATKEGNYAAEPLMRKLPDGKMQPIPYNDYRSLRWNVGNLAAGASVTVSARAKVEAVVPKETPASDAGTSAR